MYEMLWWLFGLTFILSIAAFSALGLIHYYLYIKSQFGPRFLSK